MKSQERRIKKLCEEMPNKARVRALLDAIRADDVGLKGKLLEATPRLRYTAHDAQVVDSIGAAQILSLRFDRTFYRLLAYALAFESLETTTKHDPKDFEEAADATESEICTLVAGAKIFAVRVGLDLNQVLAFSTVLDEDFFEVEQRSLDTLSEDDMRRANEMADVFQKIWGTWGNSIEDFGEAA